MTRRVQFSADEVEAITKAYLAGEAPGCIAARVGRNVDTSV